MANAKGLVISFEEPIHVDVAREMVKIIRSLRFVGGVHITDVEVSEDTVHDSINRDIVRRELGEKLYAVLLKDKK